MKFCLVILLVCISQCYSNTILTLNNTCVQSFTAAILAAHNSYRGLHSAPALKTNATIAAIAQKYANYLGTNNLFQHSGNGFGENLAASWSSSKPTLTNCSSIAISFVNMWYNEIKSYNFSNPGFSMSTGHFTQVVWKSTTQLGCGLSVDTTNRIVGVCNYYPPGNYQGQFPQNVLKPSTSGK